MNKAFCPEKEIEFNPVLDWCKSLIFSDKKSKLGIKRLEKFGGNKTYKNYETLERDFVEGRLHPADLKGSVAEKLISILEPVRKHFEQPKIRKMKEDIEKLLVTR